jgi:predicted O-methyltransferase YrrM
MNKKDKMLKFWSDRALKYEEDLRSNTNDIWIREIEIKYVNTALKQRSYNNILDFGCANGYSTIRIAKENLKSNFLGAQC